MYKGFNMTDSSTICLYPKSSHRIEIHYMLKIIQRKYTEKLI